MTIAIFVAGEASDDGRCCDEFPQYQKGCADEQFKRILVQSESDARVSDVQNSNVCTDDCVSEYDDWTADVNAKDNGAFLTKDEFGPLTYEVYEPKCEDGYLLVIVKKNDFLKKYTSEYQNTKNFQLKKQDVELILCGLLREEILLKARGPKRIFLFVHWHAASPSVPERQFNACWAELCKENAAFAHDKEIDEFESFAVSSLRPECLDVSKDKIEVPKSKKALETVISGFRSARAQDESKEAVIRACRAAGESLKNGAKAAVCDADTSVVEQQVQKSESVILLIDDDVHKDLVPVLVALLKVRYEVITLDSMGDFVKQEQANCYPLFFGTRHGLEKLGVSPPEEFLLILPLDEGGTLDWSCWWNDALESLKRRIDVWRGIREFPNGIPATMLRDWCVRAFRAFCGLSMDVHGVNALVDLSVIKSKAESPDLTMDSNLLGNLRRRVAGDDSRSRHRPLWQALFGNEINALAELVRADSCTRNDFYVRFSEKVLVEPNGTEVAFVSPTRKLNVLMVDDAADVADDPWKMIRGRKDSKFLREVISLKGIQVSADGFENVMKDIKELTSGAKSFDAVLLDLHFGKGEDSSGYQLIRVLKMFMPHTPVIVYSRYDDMWHVAEAYKMGATWYLKKDDVHKLLRHLIDLMATKGWQREWNSIKTLGIFDEDADFVVEKVDGDLLAKLRASARRRYLSYKALEKYPGRKIYITKSGGGCSSAVTFQAVKGAREGGTSFQTPVIVKIDSAFNTRLEYERYFRFIRPYIANECGRVENPERVIDDENAAIVYTFAGKQNAFHELDSMERRLCADMTCRVSCDYEKYRYVFDTIFDEILPQIHGVTPALEFFDGDIADGSASGPGLSPLSDFPNRAFGEMSEAYPEPHGVDFLGNYLCRMPISCALKDPVFVPQEKATGTGVVGYEFASSSNLPKGCCIDAFDRKTKCTVMMTGAYVDHVVRYRPHSYPCMTLWVDKCADVKMQVEPCIAGKIKDAVIRMDGNADLSETAAGNVFSGIVKSFLSRSGCYESCLDQGVLSTAAGKTACSLGEDFQNALLFIDREKNFSAFAAFPYLVEHVRKLLQGPLEKRLLDCPVGIVHGDLNFANIMLEFRKRQTTHAAFSDDAIDIRDVWLIDFARSRRDFIVHDFSVMFTASLGALFSSDVWRSLRATRGDLIVAFPTLIRDAVFARLDAVPDDLQSDARLMMTFRMLRRVRLAALRAKVSEESYALSVALGCMVASRVKLVRDVNAPASAAMIAAAFICLAELKRREGYAHA